MKSINLSSLLILISLFLLNSLQVYCQEDESEISIGTYKAIYSKILGEERRILIHLPLGYEDTDLFYPVVYHLYGDYVTTYFADAVSVIERLHDASLMPQVILVGVDNTDRYRDLRPINRDGNHEGIENFISYFKEELIPFIKNNHRTQDYNILVGPQAGGCFGFYTLINHTGLFDAFILENSFLSHDNVNEYMFTEAQSFFQKKKTLNKFLFMKVKTESNNQQNVIELENIIEENHPEGFRMETMFTSKADDFIMSTYIKYGLYNLFKNYKLPEDYEVNSLDDILKYYESFSVRYGFELNISDRILRDAAFKLQEKGNAPETKRLFQYILELYPKSLDGLFQLAQIYLSERKYEEASNLYKEFLKQRPNEVYIQNQLKKAEELKEKSENK